MRTQRTGSRTCPACGHAGPSDARWCGDCGAPLADRTASTVLHEGAEDDADVAPPAERGRRWAWAIAVVAVAALVGVVAVPGVGGDPTLLGRLDDATGRSSSFPPADELQLLWRRPVDEVADPPPPPALAEVGPDHVLVGDRVVQLSSGRAVVLGVAHPQLRLSADGRASIAEDGQVVLIDAATGTVARRAPVHDGPDGWEPSGAALGWVDGAAVFTDDRGVLGAVGVDGTVRWVADPWLRWDGAGDGTRWLVATAEVEPVDRLVVLDGRTGAVQRDVGPVGAVHAAVVLDDVLVYVDPAGVDRGAGLPIRVHGVRLDGSGRVWPATALPPVAGDITDVEVTAVDDAVAVHYPAAGLATTAVWLDRTGLQVGFVSIGGRGTTAEGWPVAAVVGDGLAHVDPVRAEVRVVDRAGVVRWQTPAVSGEGLVGDGDVLLVRTPARGTSLQSRLRLVDAVTGAVLWDEVTSSVEDRRLVAALGTHVGTEPAGTWPTRLRDQSWFDLATGRRRSGLSLAAGELDVPLPADSELTLLGTLAVGPTVQPVFLEPRADGPGRIHGVDDDAVPGGLAQLLAAGPSDVSPARIVTASDGDLAVTVGATSITAVDAASGRHRWRVEPSTAQRRDRAVLLGDAVVTVGVDGRVHAWSRTDGHGLWQGPDVLATAITGAGDQLVLGTLGGDVLVLSADGRVLQRFDVGRDRIEDVAVVDGAVLVTAGQDLVALGRGAAFVEPADRVVVP